MNRIYLCFVVLLISLQSSGQILINEVTSNNQSLNTDEDGEYSDWIELFNAGSTSRDLMGYHLTDNPDSLTKWTFPSRTISPGQFLLVWCSGKNRIGANLHTNFSIASDGETLYLSDATGSIIDNVSGSFLPANFSYGRFPNGSGTFTYLSPTPRASNNLATTFSGVITEAPQFSIRGGIYTSAQTVSLSHSDPTVTIRFTTDGSEPNENSPIYSGPITVSSRVGEANNYSMIRTAYQVHGWLFDWNPPIGEVFKITPVRARAFKSNFLPGPINTQSYFIDPAMNTRYGDLPLVSVVSDPRNLFNDTTGIYVPGINYQPNTFHANYYLPWNRPANIEMYMPNGDVAFNSNFKISVNGQSSPSSPHKGLNVNANSDYGISKINYPLFETWKGRAKYLSEFDKIKIRAWGSDRARGLFRDALAATILSETNLDLEAYRPCVVFIDGEYWGLQELRERDREEAYYKSHYGITDIDLLEDAVYPPNISGDTLNWSALMNYLNTNSLGINSNYDYVKTQIDINSFMLSYMSSIYFSRSDWPYQNEAKWRPRQAGGKWKWIQWDMDNTTAFYLNPWYNMFQQTIIGSRGYGPSPVLNALLQSTEFRIDFINLFADFMNSTFLPPHVNAIVDELKGQLSPYMQEMRDRWQANYNWDAQTDSMKWWLTLRPQYCRAQIISTFGLTTTSTITLDVSDSLKGFIKINTLTLNKNLPRLNPQVYPWTGTYFDGVPISITALAKPGYRFLYWSPGNDTSRTRIIYPNGNSSYTAVFDADPNYVYEQPPLINEVMSSNLSVIPDNYGEYDDWIEIYNPNTDTLDLANYFLTDNLVDPTRFKIAAGNDSTKIPGRGHLIIWTDNDTEQGILHTNFKLNATGDFIALIAPNQSTLIDSIRFQLIPTDVSYGRKHDGASVWINFVQSTPANINWTFTPERMVINEIQLRNTSTIADNYGDHDQWIELYNPNGDTINVEGWLLSVGNFVDQYRIGYDNDSTIIPPYGFKLLWADSEMNEGILHTNFHLSTTGGRLFLNKPDNSYSDSISWSGTIPTDESYGRETDGATNWITFSTPTPDSSNNDVGFNDPLQNRLTIWPNPSSGKVYLNRPATFTLVNSLGQKIAFYNSVSEFDVSKMQKGVYFIVMQGQENGLKLIVN